MIRLNSKWMKTFAGVSLATAFAISGNIFISPNTAKAETSVTVSASKADKIISTGKKFLGTPYQFGAKAGRTDVFDCSSFTQYVYKQYGIDLPRSSRQQIKSGTYVPKSKLRKGDLVFFSTPKTGPGKVGHVAIYMGNGKLLHTYRKGIGVTIGDMAGYWDSRYITARRVL
ncbi:C40 family peptidase [Paenibacillus sp. GYB004]|uniref:C40 family peptidase n=1 Tax=Paenibacillus sp. GYB004 TaxID=2994393 RepID=UPI002F96B127